MTNPPKFFTWVEQNYPTAGDVPERLRKYMRLLWLNGSRPEEIAQTFKLPLEWVEDFVRERDPPPAKPS